MRSIAHIRKLVIVLCLLVTGLLLTNLPSRLHRTDIQNLRDRQSPSDGAWTFARGVAVPYGRQDVKIDLVSSTDRRPRVKRALSEQFQCLVQKGRQYWTEGVLPAFDGQSRFPAPNFGDAEDKLADSGWATYNDPQALPSYWQEVFKSTKGGVPTENLVKVELDQRRDFTNAFGDQVSIPSTISR